MKRAWLALAAASLLVPGVVRAAEEEGPGGLHFSARSVTVLTRGMAPGLQTTDGQAPTFQLLSFYGNNINGTGIFGSGSGYLTQQLASGGLMGGRRGDVGYGYLGWARESEDRSKELRVQAGRQFLYAGAPRSVFMDGASVAGRMDLLELQLYGGSAVLRDLDNSFQAPLYGARLAFVPKAGHLGLAFQDIAGNADITRRTVGADGAVHFPFAGRWTATGVAAYDLLGNGMQEARLDLRWQPKPIEQWLDLYVRGEARDPLAYLPRNSIFTAFVQSTDARAGGGFVLHTPGAFFCNGSYDRYHVVGQGLAGYNGQVEGGLRIDAAGNYRTGIAYSRMSNGENGFDQGRIYGRAAPAKNFTASLDLDSYWFFRDVRGTNRSLMATLALRWTATRGVTLGVDGQVWTSPYFSQQALGMASLTVTDAFFRRTVAAQEAPKAAPPANDTKDEGQLWRPHGVGGAASTWTGSFDRPAQRGML